MKHQLKNDVAEQSYEADDEQLTAEQVELLQKFADDRARAQGKVAPSEIPAENWKTLF